MSHIWQQLFYDSLENQNSICDFAVSERSNLLCASLDRKKEQKEIMENKNKSHTTRVVNESVEQQKTWKNGSNE